MIKTIRKARIMGTEMVNTNNDTAGKLPARLLHFGEIYPLFNVHSMKPAFSPPEELVFFKFFIW